MAKVLTWWSEIDKTLNEELRNEILSLRKMFKILLELNFYSSEMWDCFPNFEYLWNQLYAIRPLLPASKWLDSKSESVLATRLWSTPVWCVLTCLVSPGALVRPVSNRCVGDLTPHFKGTLDNQSSPTFQIKEHHQHPLGQNTLISRLFELTITGPVTISFFLQNSLYGKSWCWWWVSGKCQWRRWWC